MSKKAAPGTATNNTLARKVAPFAPLAVALIAGNVLKTPAPVPPQPAPAAKVSANHVPPGNLPAPLLKTGQPVDWWFAFKFNVGSLPGCAGTAQRSCLFGAGAVRDYKFSQQFAFASSDNKTLEAGNGCAGDTLTDPIGATFDEIYNGHLFYVVWNDQFKGNPINDKDSPFGHSKGVMAWDADGDGVLMQVTTPSWPGSGSAHSPRKNDGNTLGCVADDDVEFSQDFFSLKLTADDVLSVLKGLGNSSVATDTTKAELLSNGGPPKIQAAAGVLGKHVSSKTALKVSLSAGVTMISKPSDLQVPPWQMVSSLLGGVPLRVASWWMNPEIPSSTGSTPGCWDATLAKPGAVEIATSGTWNGKSIGLKGGSSPNGNHAKVGVSTDSSHPFVIFGDMNQQGTLSGDCGSSQNGRGGLFFVISDAGLSESVSALLKGDSAPTGP